MTLSLHERVAIAMCKAAVDEANVGTTNAAAKFVIYKGPMPANIKAALGAAAPLVEMTMSNPAFAAPVDNDPEGFADALAAAVAEVPATADGTATFYRLYDRNNVAIWQGSVSEPNAGGDMELSSISVITGINVVVQSFTFRVPK